VNHDRRGPGRPWPAGVDLANARHHLPNGPEGGGPESVLTHLRESILRGELEPGAWLRQEDLAQHYNVSRTPVREALRALEREGLVRIVPNHGARVAPLSLNDFEEIYALRSGIEGLAARRAAEAAGDGDHPDLHARLERLAEAARTLPLQPYLREEWALRLACYRLTSRERLLSTILHLRGRAERYLRYAYQVEADTRQSFTFHRELVEAIVRGDDATAERTNRDALDWAFRRAWPFVKAAIEEGRTGEGGGEDGGRAG
jgi:GntR family transcriptional regulator, rspAB operon transcriptional repressor